MIFGPERPSIEHAALYYQNFLDWQLRMAPIQSGNPGRRLR
jgi:hypothetical protein